MVPVDLYYSVHLLHHAVRYVSQSQQNHRINQVGEDLGGDASSLICMRSFTDTVYFIEKEHLRDQLISSETKQMHLIISEY